jgi:hypothetical protein
MRIMDEMVDTLRCEERRTAVHAVDDISLREKKFSQIGTILPGCAGGKGHLARRCNHHPPWHILFNQPTVPDAVERYGAEALQKALAWTADRPARAGRNAGSKLNEASIGEEGTLLIRV